MAEWEAKDSADKTFAKFQLFIKKKWAKKNAKNQINTRPTKYVIANNVQIGMGS